jgi:hypothetical protein
VAQTWGTILQSAIVLLCPLEPVAKIARLIGVEVFLEGPPLRLPGDLGQTDNGIVPNLRIIVAERSS